MVLAGMFLGSRSCCDGWKLALFTYPVTDF